MRIQLKALFLTLLFFGVLSGCGGGGKEEGALYAFKNAFIVNLAKEDSGIYLKVQMGVQVSNQSVLGEIGRLEFKVRDKINYILSRQSLKSVSTDSGKDNVKREIKEALNKVLETGEVSEIYFYEFVSQ